MTITLTEAMLRQIAPNAKTDLVGPTVHELNARSQIAEIAAPLRLAHFIAQLAHESGGFRRLEEDLNYSAARLTAVWPKRFPTVADAARYAHNPEKLANFVYGGRSDLGNTAPGDGWTYRGRGYIQTTGRDNYSRAGVSIGQNLLLFPELLTRPPHAMRAAINYWNDRGLSHHADADDIEHITKKINGGLNGLADRKVYLERAKKALGV